MADFKTHITVSSTLGVAYGAVAWQHFGLPAPTCVLAGTLCGISGMLPDLDSDSGVPLRESLAFAAACVPMFLFDRLKDLKWSPETMVLGGAAVYIAIRFGFGKMLKKYTVHRGMFHSIPAAVIAGQIAFLLASGDTIYLRGYKACAVIAGFMSHLILDEIWSVRVQGGIGLKSSFGTAMKLWSGSLWGNLSCYGKLIALSFLVLRDPIWATVSPEADKMHQFAQTVVSGVEQRAHLPLPNGAISWLDSAPTSTNAQNSPPPNGAAYTTPNGPPPYAATYAPPAYVPPTYATPPTYVPQPYAPQPQYVPAPTYAPQPYAPQPQPYVQPYVQPYAQPYVQPQQAQWPTTTPYVSPRY